MTAEEAIKRIRRVGVDKETIYTCYVLDCRRLLGTVSAKDLLTAAEDALGHFRDVRQIKAAAESKRHSLAYILL